MRRKSERTASKKTKSTPEKKEKVEKVKHTRTRRRKPSSSSASESTEEPPPIVEVAKIVETKATEPKSAKEDNSNESEDQVWQVKSTESSGDVGEIQKLKLCLARPPSTPERVDRSPRSKRKHPRATSSSDGQSVEGEDKKKSRHRSKRHSESQEVEKTDDRGDKTNLEVKDASPSKPLEAETNQSCKQKSSTTDETPVSTTTDEIKCDKVDPNESEKTEEKPEEEKSTETEASKDTEVQEAQEAQEVAAETEAVTTSPKLDTDKEQKENIILPIGESPVRKRSLSAEKSEILELHAEESQCETSEVSFSESQEAKSKTTLDEDKDVSNFNPSEVSINKSTTEISGQPGSNSEDIITPNNIKDKIYPITTEDKISSINSEDSIMSDKSQDKLSPEKSQDKLTHDKSQDKLTPDNSKDKVIPENSKEKVTLDKSRDIVSVENSEEKVTPNNAEDKNLTEKNDIEHDKSKEPEKESTAIPDSTQDDAAKDTVTEFLNNKEYSQTTPDIPNGEVTPLVVNRKRRWGSRPSKLSSQKSITISTDVLKEIMPDVKPVEFDEVIEEKKHKRIGVPEKIDRPILPKIIIENTEVVEISKKEKQIEGKVSENVKLKDSNLGSARKISIVKDNDSIIARPPSPPKHKQSSILFITNLVRPFTLPQLKNLLQRTGRIVDNGFWIDRIKSKCYVKYDTEDQAVETRHALHGVTWPVSNPKTLHVDFATEEDLDKAKANEESDNAKVSTIPGTVEDWLREQDMKREKGELDKPWERKAAMREWDVGKNDKTKEAIRPDKNHRDERPPEKKRHRTIERSPEPARKFKKKEEEAPAKLLDDLFRKTKTTPCIYWLPLSAETIAVKEEQRRQHMAEHERRLQELRRTHRRH